MAFVFTTCIYLMGGIEFNQTLSFDVLSSPGSSMQVHRVQFGVYNQECMSCVCSHWRSVDGQARAEAF